MKFHWEAIQRLAKAHHCEDPVADLETFRRFLQFWWCRTYNRPFKDPLLQSYTLDELTYEYLRHLYHEPDMDPRKELEAKKVQSEDDQWIQNMMSKIQQTKQTVDAAIENVDKAKAASDSAANLADLKNSQTTESKSEMPPVEGSLADPLADVSAATEPFPPDLSTKFDE